MALKVYIAHTGQCLLSSPETFTSLNAFKVWVSENSNIALQDLIPLNTEGRHVKFPGLSSEKEIFIYDRRIIQSSLPGSAKPLKYDIAIPPKYHVPKPPDLISNQDDLEAWKDLFKARRDWAVNIAANCTKMVDEVQKRRFEMDIIIRGASNAVRNVQKHVTTVDHKNANIQSWTEDIRKVQKSTGTDWDALLHRLQSIPVSQDIIKFITGKESEGKREATLENFIDLEAFKAAKNIVRCIPRQLSVSTFELGKRVDEIYRLSDELVDIVSGHMPARSQGIIALKPMQAMHDIESLAKKVSIDCDNILDSQNPMTVSQALNSALVHKKTLLPALIERGLEIDGILQAVTETRNSLAVDSIQIMQQIFSLTSMVSDVTSRLTSLEPSAEAYDALQYLLGTKLLPVTFASFVAEGIRRKSWYEKIMIDSSTLANEMANFHEEEVKRRRKWQKGVGIALWGEKAEHNVPRLDFTLQNTDEDWPQVTKQNLENLLEVLQAEDPNSALAMEVSKIISDLDNPTKKQTKRAKAAFKAGSFHENTFGHSTLLTRGDDELIRTLQEERQNIESKFRTAESRVRRLENLLHQQSQVNKFAIGNFFQLPDHQTLNHQTTPNPFQSPRSSVASRRFSINQGSDEKLYQQKLLLLEIELAAERKRSSSLEKEALKRKLAEDSLKIQLEEANSTKKDLLQNLEAHQREFLEERKALAAEIKHVRAQKEDLEEDLDRYVDSHEDKKNDFDGFKCSLQYQVEQARNEAAAAAEKAQGEVEHLKNNTRMLRETIAELESQLQSLRDEKFFFFSRMEEAEQVRGLYLQTIHEIHRQLSPHEDIPENLNSITETIIRRTGCLVTELESTKSDAIAARTDHDNSQHIHAELKSKVDQITKKFSTEQQESIRLRENLEEHCAKLSALEAQVTDGRLLLSILRTEFSNSEDSSDLLNYNGPGDNKSRASSVAESGIPSNLHLGSLEEEIRAYHEKYQLAQKQHEKLALRMEARTTRAKDLTRRFYKYNESLCRLLERLSYSLIREGKSVIIQRLPRPERSNLNDSSEPSLMARRSASRGVEKRAVAGNEDPKLLGWMYSNDVETESENYDAYLNTVGNLDIEAFCEVITKRVKDLEYTAKKYSRDARSHKEKSHLAQKEAHEKIAFKNFKEGDLALFLPTRNQATGAWAAFNVGAPHYFLKEQDSHKLRSRDWLLARIHKIEDRVVDLSKSISGSHLNMSDRKSIGETSNGGDSLEDDNPFDLSDGLRWYLIDAAEEKPGAPTTPGLGKSTVASANIDATGSIRRSKKSSSRGMEGINRTLSKNLDCGRGRINSKKSPPAASSLIKIGSSLIDTASLKAAATTRTIEEGSEAHIIRPSSNHDGNSAEGVDRALTPEVRNQVDSR